MSTGYKSRKCTHPLVLGGLLGGHKSTPVQHKLVLFPPSLQLPIYNWSSAWAGRASTWDRTAPNNTVCTKTQLPPPRLLRRGLQKDVVYLCWPIAPSYMRPNAGGLGGFGVSANEYSCVHHVTLSLNKLWRSTSIFNLWCYVSATKPG